MNVSLPGPMKYRVEAQVKSGQYSNASDYVRHLIRRDRAYRDKREILVKALVGGENSGVSGRTLEEIWLIPASADTLSSERGSVLDPFGPGRPLSFAVEGASGIGRR